MKVLVTFEREYEEKPIVQINIEGIHDIKYYLTNVYSTHFEIELGEDATEDINFNWTALAVHEPRTVNSETPEDVENLDILKEELAPIPTPTPTPTPAPDELPGYEPGRVYVEVIDNELGFLRVREEPNINSQQISEVDVGVSLPYSDTQYGWYYIEYTESQFGWVSGSYVEELK